MDGNKAITLRVDSSRCQGHGRCCAVAPELFEVDELGYAAASVKGPVPAGLEEKARLAEASCPERAVLITEAS